MLIAFLDGRSKPRIPDILDVMWKRAYATEYRRNDKTAPRDLFTPGVSSSALEHAYPAMATWMVEQVTAMIRTESDIMITPATGLHLRATAKTAIGSLVTWDKVYDFSLSGLQQTAEEHAPVLWHLLSSYADPDYKHGQAEDHAKSGYRPKKIVCTSAVSSLTFARSSRASLYPLCRGIWLFAVKAHQSIYRVESRLGQSVSYETMRQAIHTMADAKLVMLRKLLSPDSGKNFVSVGDNVQAHSKERDHRIGRRSTMIKGFAGTAVEMEDCDPKAFDIDELLRREALVERRTLTVKMIQDDIDWSHLENVAALSFLESLVKFVPALAQYRDEVTDLSTTTLRRHQIPSSRKSKVFPLASNNADEMHIQGMKAAVDDFLSTQMGINDDTLKKRVLILSGDGKTFDQLIKLRKYLSSHEGHFESLRCMVPLLELWHTKWTDLSRTVRAHWGKDFPNDPSTLAKFAFETECPTPSDLRKVDFYDGEQIVNLALDAHLLNCWEYVHLVGTWYIC
ncbi:hypothetical protein BV25DRAFT_1816096 [Artomyces pyxidatus]|uniref:Uncharacterized protein n=1 Tax=Artomyces pyxidatus TaxID=48021 RepID=A0ACB8SFS6_9AGAM|nr:hypothetical protein BV25DRAFT_1816096 [Artomyces pyxidatus]